MNKSDSERMAAVLENKGCRPASSVKSANLIVVNMCSVRQSAVDRIFGLAEKIKKLKTANRKLKTVLTGCILKEDKIKLRKIFDSIWDQKNYFNIPAKSQNIFLTYIPISNGCSNFCSYCAVPFTRGALICRPHKKILKEVKEASAKGVNEIWLLGQNVNDYISKEKLGNKKKIINFAKLVKMVNDVPGKFKLFFISPNPNNFSNELIKSLAKCEKFGKYLNLPVQSGDNLILKKMNRPYSIKQYKELVKKIRKEIPNIRLSTDVIVGFPGETKRQFKNTVKLFKEIKFDNAYIAKYSPRSGTAAFRMKDSISLREKKQREKKLIEIVNEGKKTKK